MERRLENYSANAIEKLIQFYEINRRSKEWLENDLTKEKIGIRPHINA